jgi:LPPG:FO 2-phospho-L-lactate transferase
VSFPRVVALAGGVGAARFLSGLVEVMPPAALSVIVNTGDDRDFFGLRVCPDLDIVSYTLAGRVRRDTGWGVEGDSFRALSALRRFRSDVWFSIGDEDLATHVHRSARLREGATLTEVTAELARAFGLEIELLPMSDEPAPTIVAREGGLRSDFQEYLARDGSPDDVVDVDLSAARAARPSPAALAALDRADVVLICPSNPLVSIGTIRAVPGFEERLRERRDAVAVSPIIAGRPVKGPADRLMRAVGAEVSALGVARLYREIAASIVIDTQDRALASSIEGLGMRVEVAPTLMRERADARALARFVLGVAGVQG